MRKKSWWPAPTWKLEEMRTTAPVISSAVLVSGSAIVTLPNSRGLLLSPEPIPAVSVAVADNALAASVGAWLMAKPCSV
jgi:hypothetical protein